MPKGNKLKCPQSNLPPNGCANWEGKYYRWNNTGCGIGGENFCKRLKGNFDNYMQATPSTIAKYGKPHLHCDIAKGLGINEPMLSFSREDWLEFLSSVIEELQKIKTYMEEKMPNIIKVQEVIKKLKKINEKHDIAEKENIWCSCETSHMDADEILCDFLEYLGYVKIVREYKKAPKWYA